MNFPIKSEIIKQIISDYNYNEQNNIKHKGVYQMVDFDKLNKQRKNKMTRNNNNTPEENTEHDAWISLSKSGKGIVIALPEGMPKDTVLIGNMNTVERMVDGKIKGVHLTDLKNIEN